MPRGSPVVPRHSPREGAAGRRAVVRERDGGSPLALRSRASYLQPRATVRAPLIFQRCHPSLPWHPAAPAGAESRRKGAEEAGSSPGSGEFPWLDPARRIPRRPVPETVKLATLAGRVDFKRPAPGRSGGGRGRAAPQRRHRFRSCEMSLRPTLRPRPHLPPPLRNKWFHWLVNVPLEVAFLKT